MGAAVAGGEFEGHVASIVKAIRPAVLETKGHAGDPVDNAVRANIVRVVEEIHAAKPILAKLAAEGKIKLLGAPHELHSDLVERIH